MHICVKIEHLTILVKVKVGEFLIKKIELHVQLQSVINNRDHKYNYDTNIII